MKEIVIGNSGVRASEISLGVMRIVNLGLKDACRLLNTAIDEGINFFDNADIYEDGMCEEIFGQAVSETPGLRERILIQTKCGIMPTYYDSSKEHILNSVEKSLARLKTDYIDFFLLHRPDALVEPGDVAEAFEALHSSGKVRYFGVSNHNSTQIELLNRYCGNKIMVNQLQFSIVHSGMIDSGLNVNMKIPPSIDRDGSVMDYCRLNNITIQAWSPLQYGFLDGSFLGNDDFKPLNDKLSELASIKGTSAAAVAIAWVLRHPAGIQVVSGTTNESRLKDICMASSIELTREEWYGIYMSAGNELP